MIAELPLPEFDINGYCRAGSEHSRRNMPYLTATTIWVNAHLRARDEFADRPTGE